MAESKTTKAAQAKAEPVETVNDSGIAAETSKKDVRTAVEQGDQDRVAMASRRPDGTPAQTPGFTYIDEDAAREAAERQLTEQAVSNADAVVRVPAEVPTDADTRTAEQGEQDPAVQAISDVHEQAAKAARARVDDEFGKRD